MFAHDRVPVSSNEHRLIPAVFEELAKLLRWRRLPLLRLTRGRSRDSHSAGTCHVACNGARSAEISGHHASRSDHDPEDRRLHCDVTAWGVGLIAVDEADCEWSRPSARVPRDCWRARNARQPADTRAHGQGDERDCRRDCRAARFARSSHRAHELSARGRVVRVDDRACRSLGTTRG